jgi:hypothetical protein
MDHFSEISVIFSDKSGNEVSKHNFLLICSHNYKVYNEIIMIGHIIIASLLPCSASHVDLSWRSVSWYDIWMC